MTSFDFPDRDPNPPDLYDEPWEEKEQRELEEEFKFFEGPISLP